VPWNASVTLLGATEGKVDQAQRELVRIGLERPVAAATGGPNVRPRRRSIRRAVSLNRGKSRLGQNLRQLSCRTNTTAIWTWSSA